MTLALEGPQQPQQNAPFVMLQSQSSRTVFKLFHSRFPAACEIYLTVRAVYALRARGFENGKIFETLVEIVHVYYDANKERQPQGFDALAGHFFGSILAFETAKVLESNGEDVNLVASLKLPHHILSTSIVCDNMFRRRSS